MNKFKDGTRKEALAQAWEGWKKHVMECKDCQQLLIEAKNDADPFCAAWFIGFSTCMDMVQAGVLIPLKGTGSN